MEPVSDGCIVRSPSDDKLVQVIISIDASGLEQLLSSIGSMINCFLNENKLFFKRVYLSSNGSIMNCFINECAFRRPAA